jgi:predicted permease
MLDVLVLLLPILVMILLGYGLARTGVVPAAGEAALSNVVFFATTPALLFRSMATTPTPGGGDLLVLAGYFVPCWVAYGAWVLIARRRFGQRLAVAAVGAMAVAFANTVLLGIPIIERLYGAAGIRLLVLIVSIHSATFFTLTTLLIEADRGAARVADTLRATAITMSRNPILVAIIAGLVWGATGLRIPAPIDQVLALLGGATTTLALIAVGAGLAQFRLGDAIASAASIAAVKLVAVPLGVWILTDLVLGLDDLAVAVATISSALPVGTNVYVIARRYDVATGVAASAVVLTTVLAALSVPAAIIALR